jgi:hypothetical protein
VSFANPILFALGFAFVALPIVLHFLRRRRPPVMWGAMRFLVEAYRRRRRRMTLEQLLLLLCRCALVIVVALLIGRPILGADSDDTGPREVLLVIDNSIASARSAEGGSALDVLKDRASELLAGLDSASGDRAALISLAGPAEAVVFPASGDIGAVQRRLMSLEPRDSAADLAGAFAIIGSSGADAEPAGRSVVVLSELRLGSTTLDAALPPLPASVERLVASEPSEEASANVAIAEVRSLRSVVIGAGRVGGQASVRLERSGDAELPAAEVGVELWAAGGGRLGEGRVMFDAGQQSATGLVWFDAPASDAAGPLLLEARLTGAQRADTLTADDRARTPIDRRRTIEVGVIARRSLVGRTGLDRLDAADWVRLALSPESESSEIRTVDIVPSGVDGPRLSTLDAAVLLEPALMTPRAWQDLRAFVDAGGLLVVTPSGGEDVQLWTDGFLEAMDLGWSLERAVTERDDTLATELAESDSGGLLQMLAGEFEALATGVGVSRLLRIDPAGSPVEVRTAEGDPFVVVGAPTTGSTGRGLVVFMAAPPTPAWTDLPATPLMVPMFQEIVRQGVGRAAGSVTTVAGRLGLGDTALIPLSETGEPVGDASAGPIRDAGVFRVAEASSRKGGLIAVNPDIAGSRLDPVDRTRLAAWLAASAGGEEQLAWLDEAGVVKAAAGDRGESDPGRLALVLATLAAALAVVETLLARVASRGTGDAALAGGATP